MSRHAVHPSHRGPVLANAALACCRACLLLLLQLLYILGTQLPVALRGALGLEQIHPRLQLPFAFPPPCGAVPGASVDDPGRRKGRREGQSPGPPPLTSPQRKRPGRLSKSLPRNREGVTSADPLTTHHSIAVRRTRAPHPSQRQPPLRRRGRRTRGTCGSRAAGSAASSGSSASSADRTSDPTHAPSHETQRTSPARPHRTLPPNQHRNTCPLCGIPSGCCSFTGPWTVTRSSLRMLRRVAAFCRPLRPVLLLVSFPRSQSPVVGVLGLC